MAGGKETCSEYLKELGIGEEPEGQEEKKWTDEDMVEFNEDELRNVMLDGSENIPSTDPDTELDILLKDVLFYLNIIQTSINTLFAESNYL